MLARYFYIIILLFSSLGFAQTQPPAESKPLSDVKLDEWNRDDWMVVKPKLSLFEMNGYFRMRGYMFRRFDFKNQAQWEINQRYPLSDGTHANFSSANLRLRLEPRINITENIQVLSTVDVLDNLSLGSTPNTLPPTTPTPLNVLSNSQSGSERHFNSVSDAILVRRVYGRVTALNDQLELRFGRMPDHWGLGMMTNSGDCWDCDFGHTVDRVAGTFKVSNFLFTPMFDWVSTGPATLPFGSGSAIDSTVWDDAIQYSLRIARQDPKEAIQERIARGETVVNYGLWNAIRTQSNDINPNQYTVDANGVPTNYNADVPIANGPGNSETRDALVYKGDGFVQIYNDVFEIGAEGAVIAGKFKDSSLDGTLQTINILQYGGAIETRLKPRSVRSLQIGLKSGVASGDKHAGFGALDQAYTQYGTTRSPGSTTVLNTDRSLNNFQFSPDYHLDLLMYRRIIGNVTDSWYVSPEVAYLFDKKILGKLWLVYSQAMYRSSTASCMLDAQNVASCGGTTGIKGGRPMGLELDSEVSYGMGFDNRSSESPLKAALNFGMLFPFGAFTNNQNPNDPGVNASFAWTLQARMYLTF